MTASSAQILAPNLGYEHIVLFGDSLTELGTYDPHGWGNSLARRYNRKLQVSGRGLGGYNSYWLKFAISPILADFPPSKIKLFVLLIGTNDSTTAASNQHVPVEIYRENLSAIIALFRAHSSDARVLVLTPPPISASVVYDNYQFENSRNYRDACIEAVNGVSFDHVALLDTWSLLVPDNSFEDPSFDPTSIDRFFGDKLHLSELGNDVFYEGIAQKIDKEWPELNHEVLATKLPSNYQLGPPAILGDDTAVKEWLFQDTD
ncbi:hypothetical protein HK100_007484 [Physocladia obscura]|uniref:SGNH hydrolase-type esterase domain-containing protein n=1 Tax=Physocladia obscura TaxID=109957 RepID=A0AAD5SPC6_9FUNG|nr:hypothetical protein HK100_007484 [Physocladia obscura]